MPQVIVTIIHSQNKKIDLALPLDISSQVIAGAVAEAIGINPSIETKFSLAIKNGKEIKRIAPDQTLLKAGVMYGDYLELTPEDTVSPTNITQAQVYLKTEHGELLKLNERATLIGRRSPGVIVDLDLTKLDSNRLVSRRHASIEKQNDRYVILDEGSANGTFIADKKLVPHRGCVLHEGDVIYFGGPNGVQLIFSLKS
jgi:hypothetical protein